MEASIVFSALMLGLAGAPHCTAMCSAPCAAVIGRGHGAGATVAFHAGRLAGYAAAGAVAAGSVAALSSLSQVSPMLRPLWALVHAGLFVLGLWLLWQGRQPALLAQWGRGPQPALAGAGQGAAAAAGAAPGGGWQPVSLRVPSASPGPQRSTAWRTSGAASAGALWFLWPCGLLQSALMVAALSSSALGGAAAMAVFAGASSAGLVLAPWVWRRLGRAGGERAERWALRGAGAMMAAMSGWALTSGLWHRFAEYCATL